MTMLRIGHQPRHRLVVLLFAAAILVSGIVIVNRSRFHSNRDLSSGGKSSGKPRESVSVGANTGGSVESAIHSAGTNESALSEDFGASSELRKLQRPKSSTALLDHESPLEKISPDKAVERMARHAADLDARKDGWESEAFSELASARLAVLAGYLKHSNERSRASLESLLAADFSCGNLRSARAELIYRDTAISITRLEDTTSSVPRATVPRFRGAEGLVEAFADLIEPISGGANVRAKFKIYHVELTDEQVVTRQLLAISAATEAGMFEHHATWSARWSAQLDDSLPKLKSIDVEKYHEVDSRTDGGTLLTDCTESAIGHNRAYRQQLRFGIDHWLQRLESLLIGPFGHQGLAIGDANGDGLDDLYICQPGGLSNVLLIQNEDGTATDRAGLAGVDILDFSRSALFVDLDNDNDQDLIIATVSHVLIYSNDGQSYFSLRAKIPEIRDTHSLAAADYNNDGRVDIYACVYSGDGGANPGSPTPVPIHDARNGGQNVLLRNDINDTYSPTDVWRFTDVTVRVGLDTNNRRWSYAAAWEDYDIDGDIDLYVANDFGRNAFYRNDHGRFVDASKSARLEEAAFGMSVAWGDYNHDGLMDVYVGNMFSGAGNRITNQPAFQPGATSETRQALRYTARGNSLFQNRGDGTFRDVSVEAGVTMGRWAWSSVFVDINNDSRLDLLVGNGFLSRDSTNDL